MALKTHNNQLKKDIPIEGIYNPIMKKFKFIFKDSEGNITLGTTHEAPTLPEACKDLEAVFTAIDWTELFSVTINP